MVQGSRRQKQAQKSIIIIMPHAEGSCQCSPLFQKSVQLKASSLMRKVLFLISIAAAAPTAQPLYAAAAQPRTAVAGLRPTPATALSSPRSPGDLAGWPAPSAAAAAAAASGSAPSRLFSQEGRGSLPAVATEGSSASARL